MTNNSCGRTNARGKVDDQGSSLGHSVNRKVVAVAEVAVSGGMDPEVLLELRHELSELHLGDEIEYVVQDVLRRHARSLKECQIVVITEGENPDTNSVTAAECSLDNAPLARVDRVLRKVFRQAQYEIYFKGLVADAQRSIWEAKARRDTGAEAREYVWFVINLARLVPSWIWAIALRAVAGMVSRQ